MLNNFRIFKELVFFDLWIPDSGFRIPDSGFWILVSGSRFQIPVPGSGFRFPGFRVALNIINPADKTNLSCYTPLQCSTTVSFAFYLPLLNNIKLTNLQAISEIPFTLVSK